MVDFNQPNQRHLNNVVDAFMEYMRGKHADDEITLHIIRRGKKIEKKSLLLLVRPRLMAYLAEAIMIHGSKKKMILTNG